MRVSTTSSRGPPSISILCTWGSIRHLADQMRAPTRAILVDSMCWTEVRSDC
ncbi:MAG: hypothetical protein JWN03_4756 [Nocardia sp.]|nr:hypothetical protein [Nocardia sp.]